MTLEWSSNGDHYCIKTVDYGNGRFSCEQFKNGVLDTSTLFQPTPQPTLPKNHLNLLIEMRDDVRDLTKQKCNQELTEAEYSQNLLNICDKYTQLGLT
jgi:hypothetical protein